MTSVQIGVVVVVSLFLLSSLAWAMPSVRERRISKMRQLAMMEGLDVRMGGADDPGPVCYRLGCVLTFPGWVLAPGASGPGDLAGGWHWEVPPVDGGVSLGQLEQLERALKELPAENIICIRGTISALELWWDEECSIECVANVRKFLYTLQALLVQGASKDNLN